MNPGPLEDREKASLDALMHQYNSLRAESMNSINNRIQVMVLGMAAIAALIGGSLTIQEPHTKQYLVYSVFSIAVPLVSTYILLVWAGEAMRAHRAGYFIANEIEPQVNAILGRSVLSWETSLWSKRLPRDEMFGPSMVALAVPGLFAVACPPIGMILAGIAFSPDIQTILVLGLPYLGLLGAAIYIVGHMSRLKGIPLSSQVKSRSASQDDKTKAGGTPNQAL